MTDERTLILERIRQALKTAHLPAARSDVPRSMPSPSTLDAAALVESFARELTALKGQVHGPHTPAQALETVIDLLRQTSRVALSGLPNPRLSDGVGNPSGAFRGQEILAWDDDALPVDRFSASARREGFAILAATVANTKKERLEKHAQLARAAAGVTGAMAGLADTGSIIVNSDAARPRLASLLPPVHIALLRVADLYPSLSDFLSARTDLAHLGSNVVIISGPSRTADIELTPVVGVHGPKVVHVVLVEKRL